MQNQRGFVGVLIAILLGIVVLGGGAYYVAQQQAPKQTASENFDNVQALPTTQTTTQAPTKASAQQQEDETIILVNLARGTSEQEATPLVRLLKENKSVFSAEYVSPEQMLAERGFPSDAPPGTVGNPFDGLILVHVKEPSLRAEVAAFIKAQGNPVVQYVDW